MKTKKSVYTLKSIMPRTNIDGYKWHYETDEENNFECFVDDVGVFSSVKSAENAIATLVGNKTQENIRWRNWETYVGFIVEEHYLDDSVDEFGNISHFESCRSYLSNGTLNCVSECDERCKKKFNGTRYPNVHVKKGDIALVLSGRKLVPVLVEETSITKEDWKKKMKPGTYGDYTDDSGLVFTAYYGHEHPFAPMLFPMSCLPKAKVKKEVIKKMKDLRKGYFEGNNAMTNEEDKVYQDWLEFKSDIFVDENNLVFINLKRSEISEVVQCQDDEKWTKIYMKNGNEYYVYMPYNKVMELV